MHSVQRMQHGWDWLTRSTANQGAEHNALWNMKKKGFHACHRCFYALNIWHIIIYRYYLKSIFAYYCSQSVSNCLFSPNHHDFPHLKIHPCLSPWLYGFWSIFSMVLIFNPKLPCHNVQELTYQRLSCMDGIFFRFVPIKVLNQIHRLTDFPPWRSVDVVPQTQILAVIFPWCAAFCVNVAGMFAAGQTHVDS